MSTPVQKNRLGPVVAEPAFDTDEEALAIADDTVCGPAATVWSHDIDRALTPARDVRAGTVAVNGPDAEHASLLPRPDRDSGVEGSWPGPTGARRTTQPPCGVNLRRSRSP
ncbi:aldehyde dehydrogenase family protein [Streptomyces phaeochromogenes]|uniref:aldehyde dehydrogenase family protein n=1 Tax=Streptomyces phaeochromogenes TaxID=1923 RepID=UPI00371B92CC